MPYQSYVISDVEDDSSDRHKKKKNKSTTWTIRDLESLIKEQFKKLEDQHSARDKRLGITNSINDLRKLLDNSWTEVFQELFEDNQFTTPEYIHQQKSFASKKLNLPPAIGSIQPIYTTISYPITKLFSKPYF